MVKGLLSEAPIAPALPVNHDRVCCKHRKMTPGGASPCQRALSLTEAKVAPDGSASNSGRFRDHTGLAWRILYMPGIPALTRPDMFASEVVEIGGVHRREDPRSATSHSGAAEDVAQVEEEEHEAPRSLDLHFRPGHHGGKLRHEVREKRYRSVKCAPYTGQPPGGRADLYTDSLGSLLNRGPFRVRQYAGFPYFCDMV